MSKGPWTEPRGKLCVRDSEKKHRNRNLRRSLQGGGRKTAECDITEAREEECGQWRWALQRSRKRSAVDAGPWGASETLMSTVSVEGQRWVEQRMARG